MEVKYHKITQLRVLSKIMGSAPSCAQPRHLLNEGTHIPFHENITLDQLPNYFKQGSSWQIANGTSGQGFFGALVVRVEGTTVIFRSAVDGREIRINLSDQKQWGRIRQPPQTVNKTIADAMEVDNPMDPQDLSGGTLVEVRRQNGKWVPATIESIDPTTDSLLVKYTPNHESYMHGSHQARAPETENLRLQQGHNCRVRSFHSKGPVKLNGIIYESLIEQATTQIKHVPTSISTDKGRELITTAHIGLHGAVDPYDEHILYNEATSQGWYNQEQLSPHAQISQPQVQSPHNYYNQDVLDTHPDKMDLYALRNHGWRRGYYTHLKGGVRGLANMGNTCFMNSVLQSLMHCGMLAEAVMEMPLDEANSGNLKLTLTFREALLEHWKSSFESSFRPLAIKTVMAKNAPQFIGNQQHDAQEFLVYFLDALHEELNEVKTKIYKEIDDSKCIKDEEKARLWWDNYEALNRSCVKNIFVGQIRSRVKCSQCSNISVVFDPFWNLSVPIPNEQSCSLAQCLGAFIEPESLTGDNKCYCTRCKVCTDSFKEITLFRCPDVIVIHLKRFRARGSSMSNLHGRSTRGSGFAKLVTEVSFPVEEVLDLRPFCAPQAHQDQYDHKEPLIYNLVSVVNHYGASGAHGHYTADCFVPNREQWYHFDDSSVTPTRPQSLDRHSAYVMVYARATV